MFPRNAATKRPATLERDYCNLRPQRAVFASEEALMVVQEIVWIVLLIVVSQVAVWSLLFYRMNRQAEAIRSETRRSGEMIILGPVRANYQGWNGRFGVTKTIGTLALMNRRLLFKRPLGPDITIHLTDVAEASDTLTLGSRQITSESYVSLKLQNGSWVVFMLPNARQWIDAIRERLVAV